MTEQECANRAASIILQAKDCIRRYKLREGEKDRAFMLLGGLREHESHTGQPVTITEMARVSGLAVPNVSRLIKPYEEAGLLRRENRDGRYTLRSRRRARNCSRDAKKRSRKILRRY